MATADVTSSTAPKGAASPKGDSGRTGRPGYEEATDPERVRDVVLGTQLRELERRYGRLEDRLLKELGNLRAEMTSRMESLEHHAKSEVEAVATRLAQETQDRQGADKQLGDEAHQAKTLLTKDLDSARQTLAKSERELRQALLDTSKSLLTELHRLHDDLAGELTEEVHALEDGKVARSGLAAMLSDVIVRLNAGTGGGGGRFET